MVLFFPGLAEGPVSVAGLSSVSVEASSGLGTLVFRRLLSIVCHDAG